MPINYAPTVPVAGAARNVSTTEVERWTDYAATIGDVNTRLTAGVTLTGTQTISGLKTVQPSAAAAVGLIVQGVASQAGDLQQWRNSAGTVRAKVASSGAIVSGQYSVERADTTGYARVGFVTGAGADWWVGTRGDVAGSPLLITDDNSNVGRAQFGLLGSNVGFTVFGVGTQTANLQEWNNGGVVAKVSASGVPTFTMTALLRTLELGAVDSAGAGFRTVRVPN